jgi:hypothetical protein
MQRDLSEVVASQFAMLRLKGVSDLLLDADRIMSLYRTELDKVEDWLARQDNFDTEYIDYRRTLADPQGTCARIKNFLGLDLDATRMASIITRSLYRQRGSKASPFG